MYITGLVGAPDNRAYRPPGQIIRPILNLKTVLRRYCNLATELVQVVIDQSYSLTPQGPIRTNTRSADKTAYRPPAPTTAPILNPKTVLRRYYNWLHNWYRLL
jgi:hypothetical protein